MQLKEYLDNSGIRQNFLASKVGISKTILNSYVLGKKTPNIETAWKIHMATNGAVSFRDWLTKEMDIEADTKKTKETEKNKDAQPAKKRVRL